MFAYKKLEETLCLPYFSVKKSTIRRKVFFHLAETGRDVYVKVIKATSLKYITFCRKSKPQYLQKFIYFCAVP